MSACWTWRISANLENDEQASKSGQTLSPSPIIAPARGARKLLGYRNYIVMHHATGSTATRYAPQTTQKQSGLVGSWTRAAARDDAAAQQRAAALEHGVECRGLPASRALWPTTHSCSARGCAKGCAAAPSGRRGDAGGTARRPPPPAAGHGRLRGGRRHGAARPGRRRGGSPPARIVFDECLRVLFIYLFRPRQAPCSRLKPLQTDSLGSAGAAGFRRV